MIRITVPGVEKWDEAKSEFIYEKPFILQLEHSLVSLYKWESKWNKSFLNTHDKTTDQTIDYIKCMTITQNVPDYVYENLSGENIFEVSNYINAPMTATTFPENETQKFNRKIITAEVIYSWMIALHIPHECQKWHLNKLLTLIRVCDLQNNPPKKMSRQEILRRNAELNAARRNKLNTKG